MKEIGEIICYHEVLNDPEELQLISEKFDKNIKLEIYVNETKVNDSIKYKTDQKGIYHVKIILFEYHHHLNVYHSLATFGRVISSQYATFISDIFPVHSFISN